MNKIKDLLVTPPRDWDEFEEICLDLWRCIWNDPNTQRNGTQGTKQNGVDIYGQRDQNGALCGVQCKLKEDWGNTGLSIRELESEVVKAKGFEPPLSEYTIATTGKVTAKVLEKARIITQENQKNGFFSVFVISWDNILSELDNYPQIAKKHYDIINNSIIIEEIHKIQETQGLVSRQFSSVG